MTTSIPCAIDGQPRSTANLDAQVNVAAGLLISPGTLQEKPILDRDGTDSPASLLIATRKMLNLTQREFGILLSTKGAPFHLISPSAICQYESAFQALPSPLLHRAVAAKAAAQRFGEYLSSMPNVKANDAASALMALGPGCLDSLQPCLAACTVLSPDERSLVHDFLAIVTKRQRVARGSKPGARGPYRKLSKHFKGATASSTKEKSTHDMPRSALRVLGLKANESVCEDHGSRASPNSTMDSHGECVVDSHDISHLPVAMATLAGYA